MELRALTSNKIELGAVTTNKIQADAVTIDKVESALKNDLDLSCEADTFVFGKNVDGAGNVMRRPSEVSADSRP